MLSGLYNYITRFIELHGQEGNLQQWQYDCNQHTIFRWCNCIVLTTEASKLNLASIPLII